MNEIEPGQAPGETIGLTSGLRQADLDPVPAVEPPPGAPAVAPRAVIFIADDVDPDDVLNDIEVVRVSKDVIADQIQRRT